MTIAPKNATIHFMVEGKPEPEKEGGRYAKEVMDPPFYGISTNNYERDRKPMGWPSGTEYQHSYCSNYRPILKSCQTGRPLALDGNHACSQWMAGGLGEGTCNKGGSPYSLAQRPHDGAYDPQGHGGGGRGHQLHAETPVGYHDTHYQAGAYSPDDAPGHSTRGSPMKGSNFGPVKIGCQERFDTFFTPNYRYKDWVDQPTTKILKDLKSVKPICRVPEINRAHINFYHERLGRPPPPVGGLNDQYRACRVTPIPIREELLNHPTDDYSTMRRGPSVGCTRQPMGGCGRCMA